MPIFETRHPGKKLILAFDNSSKKNKKWTKRPEEWIDIAKVYELGGMAGTKSTYPEHVSLQEDNLKRWLKDLKNSKTKNVSFSLEYDLRW